jgi:ADP-heptose:LPS heptosyltransferase
MLFECKQGFYARLYLLRGSLKVEKIKLVFLAKSKLRRGFKTGYFLFNKKFLEMIGNARVCYSKYKI